MDYGIQLYSVKDFMEKDVDDTIRQIAEMGYTMVEPAGYYEKSAEEFKAICDKYGVKIYSTHCTHHRLLNGEHKTTIPYHQVLDCPVYVTPGCQYSTKAELDRSIGFFNDLEPMLKENGMELMYHNHHAEFLPNKDGIIPHLEMQKRTNIRFEVDVYWVYRAGLNPIYILEQLGDRVGMLHLKDGTDEHGTPLGQGVVDIPAIVNWAKARNIPMVVENEPVEEVQMKEAKECIDYLKTLEA